MALTLDGTTGVSAVQAGAVESGDLPAGSVIQVVRNVESNKIDSNSTSFVGAFPRVNITPFFSSSNILLMFQFRLQLGTSSDQKIYFSIMKNNTIEENLSIQQYRDKNGQEFEGPYVSLHWLSTNVNTTSEVEFRPAARSTSGSRFLVGDNDAVAIAMEIAG